MTGPVLCRIVLWDCLVKAVAILAVTTLRWKLGQN